MFEWDGKYSAGHTKAKFWLLSVKNRKKSAVKLYIEKLILFNFVNLSKTFCSRFDGIPQSKKKGFVKVITHKWCLSYENSFASVGLKELHENW